MNISHDEVDESWICLDSFPERNWHSRHCFFLFLQQFNRTWPAGPYLEAFAIGTLSACSVLFNIVALVQFRRAPIRFEFFVLLATLTFCNLLFCLLGFILAAARLLDDWVLLGDPGCKAFFVGSFIAFYMAIWSMTVISVERRLAIKNNQAAVVRLKRFGSIKRRNSSRRPVSNPVKTCQVAVCLVFLFVLTSALWIFYFVIQQRSMAKKVYIRDKLSGTGGRNVTVCTIFTKNYSDITTTSADSKTGSLLVSSLILVTTMAIPVPILVANYWSIFKTIRTSVSRKDSPVIVRSFSVSSRHRMRRDVFMAKLMTVTLAMFCFCNAPSIVYIFLVLTDDVENHPQTQSSVFVVCLALAYANAALSPLIQSVSTQGRTRRPRCGFDKVNSCESASSMGPRRTPNCQSYVLDKLQTDSGNKLGNSTAITISEPCDF